MILITVTAVVAIWTVDISLNNSVVRAPDYSNAGVPGYEFSDLATNFLLSYITVI